MKEMVNTVYGRGRDEGRIGRRKDRREGGRIGGRKDRREEG